MENDARLGQAGASMVHFIRQVCSGINGTILGNKPIGHMEGIRK